MLINVQQSLSVSCLSGLSGGVRGHAVQKKGTGGPFFLWGDIVGNMRRTDPRRDFPDLPDRERELRRISV